MPTRDRTKCSKGYLSRDGMLHMIFKLGECSEKNWRKKNAALLHAQGCLGNKIHRWRKGANSRSERCLIKSPNTRFNNNSAISQVHSNANLAYRHTLQQRASLMHTIDSFPVAPGEDSQGIHTDAVLQTTMSPTLGIISSASHQCIVITPQIRQCHGFADGVAI
jgi:hypothetical protein